jgi:mannose-6-phosphate isomerase-like protein (cupin superfamily)
LHHEQDERFYAIQGEFAVEVGDERFQLKPGDSLFAPRKVPHVWAHISDDPGTLLTTVSPAGTFETFLRDAARLKKLPTPGEVKKAFAAHGMKVVGPPLKVD